MKETELRVGIVGVGYLGSLHAKLLSEIPNANLTAIYDIIPERTREVGRKFNSFPASSLEELLERVEAVTCCVPTNVHYKVAREILNAGKPLFLEKPIATTLREARELKTISEKKGVIFQLGYVERFNPAIKKIKETLKNPMFIESERLSLYSPRGTDVDVILDLMIHDIDIVLWLLPLEVKIIDAVGVPVLTERVDIANARLELGNKAVVNLTGSRVSREKYRKIRFFQKNMYISIDYAKRSAEVFAKVNNKIIPVPVEIPPGNPLKEELELFINSVLDNGKPAVTSDEAIRALELALRIQRKIKKKLKLLEEL